MKIFRSYDIRGVVGKDLNEKIAERIGLSFGTYLQGCEDVIVGMDMRVSSQKLKKSFINGITKTGCNVIDIGMVTTPMVAFSIAYLEKNAGVSVTASHNPANWNGFKLKGKKAVNLTYDRELKMVENIFISKDFLKNKKHGIVIQKDIRKIYADKMYSSIKLNKKLKVVLDVGNGMGGIAEAIYRDIGCDVITYFKEPDGTFPNHIPNPAEKDNMKFLQRAVVRHKADLGIAFDADCDRVGVVDNKGRIVRNDVLYEIFLQSILSKKKGNVICDVRTPSSVIDFVKNFSIDPIISRAGSGYIMKQSIDEEAVFAGEMSGHFWFGDEWFHIDDGIYSGAKIIEILSNSRKSLAKIVDEMPKNYFMPSKRIKCPERKKEKVIAKLKTKFERTNEIIEIDGIKIVDKDYNVLVRPSRTEPQLEIVIESKKNNIASIYKKFEKIIKSLI
ncbi:MAG: phosphomannomutase/phosphoglucomutase [Candidatus Aenigmatarchaeota archaeon]|nr:phosphomannomutase/phosphoglucomutase [Candidatus Aenigmarchaeota archaeon]